MGEDTKEEKRRHLTETLPQFNGTEHYYRHSLAADVNYTDGVKYVAEVAGAYWLIDEIVFLNKYKAIVRGEEFQVWTLTVADDRGKLACDDGNGRVVFSKRILYTDFPLDEIKFYFENNVLMLPSER